MSVGLGFPQLSPDRRYVVLRWLAELRFSSADWHTEKQRFDLEKHRVVGDPVSVASGIAFLGPSTQLDLTSDLAVDGTMMSVDVTNPLMPAAPRKLFASRLVFNGVSDQYDITADGQRFLMIVPESQQATRLTVLTSWPSVLTAR